MTSEPIVAEVKATRYTVTIVPEKYWKISGAQHLMLYIEYRGENSWAVVDGFGASYNSEGEVAHEPLPSNRTEEYLKTHRFTFDEAKEIAQIAVQFLRINRWDALEFIELCDKGELL